ncbi:MAG: hypothetical protein WCV00_02510 [Verrucomicrobiia bacterium]
MPYDPSFPPDNSELRANEFRSQFNGLDEKVEARPTTQQVADTVNNAVADKPTNDAMNSAIGAAINGTPRNVDGFSQLYITISDPPTQSEVQQLLDSYNTLILALRRNV